MSEVKFDQKLINPTPRKVKPAREKFIHITKKLDVSMKYKVIVRVISIVTALLVCALILNLFSPGHFGDFFSGSINSLVGSDKKFFNSVYEFTLLLGLSIAVLPSFKMKFWNLGGEGQVLIGGLAAALVSRYISPSVPNFLTTIIMFVAAVVAGGIWAAIPAFFKAKFDTNETLFTLMMNYIATGLIIFFAFIADPSHGLFTNLKNGIFNFSNSDMLIIVPFIVVVLMTAFMFGYLNYTKHGYELSVVGETRNTAKYIGINVKGVILRTVIISGALCGIIGYLSVAKQGSISENIMSGRGFTAVMIAWLGHMNVLEIVIMSFLVAFITRGSGQVATSLDLGTDFTKITIAVFLIVILAFEFFLNYDVHFNKNVFKNKKSKEVKE
ncbi:MAG: ABC transporter permease [Bacilli bacterium]|nr:ABC transporter permease [Bacilli bacterium]